jgi:hypothetical protein
LSRGSHRSVYRIKRHHRIGYRHRTRSEPENIELTSIAGNSSPSPCIDRLTTIWNHRVFDTKLCSVDAALKMTKRQSHGSTFPETPEAQFAKRFLNQSTSIAR